jgi:catechol 2,3-dioxygenase-like lactoylglutathione lyase family enzyme
MLKGVNHVGIGVSDMNRSMKFYGDLGFEQIMFDYTGILPGMEQVTGNPETKARVVMLKNKNEGPVGLGMIKLIYILPPAKAEPCTIAGESLWGDIGVAEAAFNIRGGVPKVFGALIEKGVKAALTPAINPFPPHDTISSYAYLRDPDNGLVELEEWERWRSLGTEVLLEGVNHVGFGVSNMKNTKKFYQQLGFTEIIFDYTGSLSSMATMLPANPPKMRILMMANYHGAWIEPIQILPPYKPTPLKKAWGHLGVMEFAIGVSNLEKTYKELQKKGIKFLNTPQKVSVDSGEWKYAYLKEPDKNYVSIVEARY